MARRKIVAALDIGTTKTVALIGEVGVNGQVDIIGFGEVASRGMRKGVVVNIEETVSSIDLAIEKAERMSGVEVSGVYLGINGPYIKSINNHGIIKIANDRTIEREDVQRVLQNAQIITLAPEQRVIQAIPCQYIVDGYDGIRDPIGMAGFKLEVEAHIIIGSDTCLQNIIKSVRSAGLKVQEVVVGTIAAAEAVILSGEKELGVLLVNIGGGTTGLALYERGNLKFTTGLPIGGDYITNDLAIGMRTTFIEAERVKRKNGCALTKLVSGNENISVVLVGNDKSTQISRQMVTNIIEPRVKEMFIIIRDEIESSGYRGMLSGGCILTGGSALMDGITKIAQEELQIPVRIGFPSGVGGLKDVVQSPQYSTAVGLILYAAQNCQRELDREDPLLGGLWERIKSWWNEMTYFL